jgi:hypothetical protein
VVILHHLRGQQTGTVANPHVNWCLSWSWPPIFFCFLGDLVKFLVVQVGFWFFGAQTGNCWSVGISIFLGGSVFPRNLEKRLLCPKTTIQ